MRTKRVIISLTPEELRAIRIAAAEANLSMAAYLRIASLEKARYPDKIKGRE